MSSGEEKEILKKLDNILDSIQWKGPPSDISHLNCPAHLARFKELGDQEEVTSRRLVRHALVHTKRVLGEGGPALRLCSIGCEDGTLDKIILDGLKEIKVDYVGLETDEQVCEAAMEKLAGVSPNISVKTVMVDYEEEDLVGLGLEVFDLIWMINCTYYAQQLTPLIQGASRLLKSTGELLIISSGKQSIEQLITRFWCHQRPEHPLRTTESVVEVLSQLNLPHTISREPISFNLTAPLKEQFQSQQSLLLLDHLVYCRLTDYPPEVGQLVAQFLQNIAQTNSDTSLTVVSSMSDMITVTPQH